MNQDGSAPEITVGSRKIGAAHPPVFWPDIDVYFRRDETAARALIDAIAEAGIGYLKGAVLQRADLCLHDAKPVPYFDHLRGEMASRPYREIVDEMVVPLDMLARLLAHADDRGLQTILSVYDGEGVNFSVASGAVALKIPSSNVTHKWLIQKAAESGLPVVIDTGRSRWEEIERAVGWATAGGAAGRLLIQHSPPGPPAPADRFHMRMLAEMSRAFDCPVGLSDHHPGLDMLPVGVAFGACVFEKGVVARGGEAGIDRAHALPADRLKEADGMLMATWQALGCSRRPAEEVPAAPLDRMGCIIARDLAAGTRLSRQDIDFAFPAQGIGAEAADDLVGRRLSRAVRAGQPIAADDLEGAAP